VLTQHADAMQFYGGDCHGRTTAGVMKKLAPTARHPDQQTRKTGSAAVRAGRTDMISLQIQQLCADAIH